MRKENLFLFIGIIIAFTLSSCNEESKTIRIGVSQCSNDEWRNKMNHEMLREAFFYQGVKVDILNAKDNNQKQIKDINRFINNNVDLLVVSPNEANAITPAVETAFEKGIPVVIVDRKISSDKYTAYVGADNYRIGYNAGKYLLSRLHSKGNVIEITGLEQSTPAIERNKGFMDAIEGEKNIHILASVNADWTQHTAQEKMDSLLQIYKKIDFVFAQNDRMALGAYDAAQRYKRDKDILFVGIDALPGKEWGVQQVINGVLDATFIYPTGGDKVIQTAMSILDKKPYQRQNILSTALVNKNNARLMQLQTNQIDELDNKVERLNNQIDEFWTRYSVQKMFLYACIIILILCTALLIIIIRAYWTKGKMNRELSSQKIKLEEQRDKLISLSKQLEDATHAKLVFFTNISHDFRTPLTLITAPVEQLLEQTSLTDQQRGLLNIVHKNVNILLRLVNQILDFRKFENNKLELSTSNVDLCNLVIEWSHAFDSLAIKKHIHFNVACDKSETDYTSSLDVEKVERIYFNVLANAFKFTPENGNINVSLSKIMKEDKEFFRLIISDDGSGISAEHINNIFDRFYNAGVNHAGSGIGLALVKAFVDLHNGSIDVESNNSKGTKFTIDLPIIKVNSDNDYKGITSITQSEVEEELSDDISKKGENEKEKERILIIDDNNDIRAYIKSFLEDKYTIIEAENGNSGIKKAMKYVPDLIISDVMMPVMDGLECCKILKSEIQTSHIPVILLTACSLEEQKIIGYDSGADSYISKPFSSKLLVSRVENIIKNRKHLKQFFEDNSSLSKEPISDIDKDFTKKFRKLIEDNLANSNVNVEELSEMMGMSRVQLYRKIKALTNYSPVELLRIARLKKAAALIASTDKTISEITYEVGFTSPSYFTKCYKEYFGENPSDLTRRKR